MRTLKDDKIIMSDFPELHKLHFSFRNGFSDRVNWKLNNILLEDHSFALYYRISKLLPKVLAFGIGLLILLGISMYFMQGEFSLEAFLSPQKIDENNFISYLIFQ